MGPSIARGVSCDTEESPRTRTCRGWSIGLVVVGWCFPLYAVPAAPPGNAAGWNAFLEGLDSLHEGQWADAVREFSAAQSNGVNDSQLALARGVAHALQGQFAAARADLAQGPGREAELWTYVVERMSGQVSAGHGIPLIRSAQKEYGVTAVDSGIPGHMIQGGNDYSTDYASFIYYEMATPYSEARKAGTLNTAPGLHEAMTKAGRWVANRIAAHREFASIHYERAERMLRQNKLREALAELTFAASAYPEDPDVLFLTAECWRRIGRPITARRIYTRVLTQKSDFTAAYLGRAQTAAQVGDRQRVEADLTEAAHLDARQTEAARAEIEAMAEKQAVTGDPKTLLQNLMSSAMNGASLETLVPQATRLHLAIESRRKRYDEWYQDQIRERQDAIRTKPNDPNAYVSLAEFLVDEVGNRFEEVEPRRGRVFFRWQPSATEEMGRAEAACDEALRRAPQNVPAMVTKAMALLALDRGPEAQRLVDRATQMSGFNDPQALVLYARFKFKQAGANQAAAYALRTPTYTSSTHNEWRSDGLWEVTTTYRHDPSAADLAQADTLMAQAATMLREAELAMQKAVQATRGTLDGLLIESEYEFWYKSRERAGALLVEAVRKHPESLKARDKLAWYYRWMLQYDNRVEAELAALNLVQTSAGPLLARVWHDVDNGGWQASQNDLDRAMDIDPTDARAAYYEAAACEAQGQADRAQAFYRIAAALEEARLALDEPAFVVGEPLARPAGDFALLLADRLHLAQAIRAQHPQEALRLLQANTTLASRLPPGGLAEPMFGAIRPDPQAPKIPVPAPENAANLLAASHLQAGKLLASLGRSDEATREYAAAASYGRQPGSMIPNISNAKGDSNFGQYAGAPTAEAQVELARSLIQQKQWDRAFQVLQAATQNNPSRSLRAEINDLTLQVVQKLNDRNGEQTARAQAQRQQAMDAQIQNNMRQAQQRENLRRSGASVDPQLVGNWEALSDDNPFSSGGTVQLSVRADGTYTWTEAGRTTTGSIQAWNTRVTLTPVGGAPQAGAYRYLPGGAFGSVAGSGNEELQLAMFTGRQYRFKRSRN